MAILNLLRYLTLRSEIPSMIRENVFQGSL